MVISLSPDIESFLEQKVKAGEYPSIDEAANRLLEHVREQEELSEEDIEDLRAEVDMGIEQLDRGEFKEFTAESVIAEQQAAMNARKMGK